MSDVLMWGLVILAPPPVVLVTIIVLAKVWKSRETSILIISSGLGCACLIAGACGVFIAGGNDARLTVRNESSWPIRLSADDYGERNIAAGGSESLLSVGEPVPVDGLIQNIEIMGGPAGATRIHIAEITGEQITVTVTNQMVVRAEDVH